MEPPSSKNQLKDFPHEIHLAIMDLLDPLDIISLAKTCHSFHLICSERTVWTRAFRRMCSLNVAFVLSYPAIGDMSVAELRQHAASPSRVTALLYKQEEPTSGHTRPCRNQRYILRPPGLDIGVFCDVFLVPGGRYLITTANHLHVWDLGLTSQDDPCLVATLQGGLNLVLAVVPTPDGNGFLIAVSAILIGLQTSIVYCNPSSSVRELSPLAKLDHLNTDLCVLTNSLFIYIHEGTLIFWSFYDDLWASYTLDFADMVTNIACQKATLFLFYDGTIRGYEMPSCTTLKTRAEFLSQPDSEKGFLHPIFTLAAAVPDVGVEFSFIDAFPLEIWHQDGPSCFSFDLGFSPTTSGGRYSSLSSYYIQPQSSPTNPAQNDWKLTTQYDFRNLIEDRDGVSSFSRDNFWRRRICNDHAIRTSQNDSRLKVLAASLCTSDPVPLAADFLLPEHHFYPTSQWAMQSTFDPISGRVCIPDMYGGIVAILDFLQPLGSTSETSI